MTVYKKWKIFYCGISANYIARYVSGEECTTSFKDHAILLLAGIHEASFSPLSLSLSSLLSLLYSPPPFITGGDVRRSTTEEVSPQWKVFAAVFVQWAAFLCSPSISHNQHQHQDQVSLPNDAIHSMALLLSLSTSSQSLFFSAHCRLENEKLNDNDGHWLMIDCLGCASSCAAELRPTRPVLCSSLCSCKFCLPATGRKDRAKERKKERIIAQLMTPVTQIGAS